jgi:hypothetical protein
MAEDWHMACIYPSMLFKTLFILTCSAALSSPGFAQDLLGGKWTTTATFTGTALTPLGQGAVGVNDSNFDGVEDIAMANLDSLQLYSGLDGQLIRSLDLNSYYPISPTPNSAGDVDADGVPDFIVQMMTPYQPLVVISGMSGAELLNIPAPGPEFDQFGGHQRGAGDINNDGYDDVVVVNHHGDFVHDEGGVVLIYSGLTGSLIHQFNGNFANASLGVDVVATGDQDGDGFDDLVVASPGHHLAQSWFGEVTMFSGATGGILWTIQNPEPFADFGARTLQWAKDLDGDGHGDLLVSSGAQTIAFSGQTQQEIRRYDNRNVVALADFDGDRITDLEVFHEVVSGLNNLRMLDPGATISVLDTTSSLGYPQLLLGRTNPNEVALMTFNPYLTASTINLSASAGGNFEMLLDFGPQHAGNAYQVLLSKTGMGPHSVGLVEVPLSGDGLMARTWSGSYPGLAWNPVGTLTANGKGLAGFLAPPGQYAGVVGQTTWAATVVFENGIVTESSVAVQLSFTP